MLFSCRRIAFFGAFMMASAGLGADAPTDEVCHDDTCILTQKGQKLKTHNVGPAGPGGDAGTDDVSFDDGLALLQKKQKLMTGANRDAELGLPRKIYDNLRVANYDCSAKGAMLRNYINPTVLEAGAHDGEEWGVVMQYAAHLWAVEPSPDKKAWLEELPSKMGMPDKIDFFPMALSSKTGMMKFWVDGENSQQNTVGKPPPWVTQADFEAKSITVNVSTVDDFWVTHMGKQHITMLKVDTQGHEPAIITGASKLLAEDPPDLLHLEFSPGLMKSAGLNGTQMLHFLYDKGYRCCDCPAFGPPPINQFRSLDEYEKHFGAFSFHGVDAGSWADLVCTTNFSKFDELVQKAE